MKKLVNVTFAVAIASMVITASADDKTHAKHWSYQGKTAPAHWAELDAANTACRMSKEQSPINIVEKSAKKAILPTLDFQYVASSAEVVNNGHTIQINLPAGSSLKTGVDEANLLQFHFHTPSEEKINNINYPMVAHFVHKLSDGKLSVVAVLFKKGKENTALAPIFAVLPSEGKSKTLSNLDLAAIIPAQRTYYKFTGSLTTPPCSDGVRWQVLKQPVELSASQIAAFKKFYQMNARPVQPLNGRLVEISE